MVLEKINFWTNWTNRKNHLTSVAALVSGFGSNLSGKGPTPNITPSKTSQTDVMMKMKSGMEIQHLWPQKHLGYCEFVEFVFADERSCRGLHRRSDPNNTVPELDEKNIFLGTPKHLGVKAMVFRRFSLQNQSKWQPWLVATSKWLSLKTGYPAIWWLVG